MTRHGIITDQPCHREDVTLEQTHSHTLLSNSYTMGCPPVRGLFYVQVDKRGIAILCHLHQCRPCTSRAISC